MTIRTRMTLWYAGMLLFSALLIAGLSIKHLNKRQHNQHEEDDWEDVVEVVLWIGIPAALLSVGGGWWLMRKAFAPVSALTQAVENTHDHNLREQLPRTGNGDELDRLTEVFNSMTARLDASFSRIREFTLHASHELKTPLTVLHGEMETALRNGSLAPAQRETVLGQLDEVQRLTQIVDGLTLLTKAGAGQIALDFGPLQFDEIVRDIFADVQILARPRGVQVSLMACEPVAIRGDRHRLRQLLLNLADNAVKYCDAGGAVRMELHAVDDGGRFIMVNTGPGIPPKQLPRVFEPFFRGDASHHREVDGCGLGLSIAQWIAVAHHGSVKIESTPDKLTTVTFRFPLLEDPAHK